MYRNIRLTSAEKLNTLLDADKNIFTSSDLSTLWGITNKNTLWTTIKRYVQKKSLHRIRKGIYSKTVVSNLNPYEIGCALAGPFSYISLEVVLQQHGVIMQRVNKITLVGDKKVDINFNGISFRSRSMDARFLLNRTGIIDGKRYSTATLERAVADVTYYNPKYYFDNKAGIDWGKVSKIKKLIGY